MAFDFLASVNSSQKVGESSGGFIENLKRNHRILLGAYRGNPPCGRSLARFLGVYPIPNGVHTTDWVHTLRRGGGWRGTQNSNRMRRDTRRKGFRFQWRGLKDYNRVWGLAYNTSAPRVETHASFWAHKP